MSERSYCSYSGKIIYESLKAANKSKVEVTKRSDTGGNLSSFKCSHCHGWHIGRSRTVRPRLRPRDGWAPA